MSKPLSSRVRGCSLALSAVGLAAILPLPASAQCWGPFATIAAAQETCRRFIDTGFCTTNPDDGGFVEVVGYFTPEGWPAAACCCQPLLALELPPIEEQEEQSPEEQSSEE